MPFWLLIICVILSQSGIFEDMSFWFWAFILFILIGVACWTIDWRDKK